MEEKRRKESDPGEGEEGEEEIAGCGKAEACDYLGQARGG